MKKIILIGLISAFGIFAYAVGNEGAQATPSMPGQTKVLAEYYSAGGFMVPPNMPYAYGYQILTNGKAIVLTYHRNQKNPEVKVLKTYSPSELLKISNLVSKVKAGELYDKYPMNPGCMDAPTFTFTVYNQAGKIKIAQRMKCKEMSRKNAGPADKQIVKILQALAELHNR